MMKLDEILEVICFFASGYLDEEHFEDWLYSATLEEVLESEVYMKLISTDYNDDNDVISIREYLISFLKGIAKDCSYITDAYCEKRFQNSINDTNLKVFELLYQKFSAEPPREIYINLANVKNSRNLHVILKEKLNFPIFYGMNWDAFWDCITGMVDLPQKIVFVEWSTFQQKFPRDAAILLELLTKLNEQYPSFRCEIEKQN